MHKEKKTNEKKKLLLAFAAVLFWALAWGIASAAVGNELLLPGPLQTAKRLVQLTAETVFWKTALFSLSRVLLGLVIAVVLGCMSAALCFRFHTVDVVISPLMNVIKATPVASFIILLLLWIGNSAVPMTITALMALPIFWANVKTGLTASDPGLLEVARVYGLSQKEIWKYNYVPAALPYFYSALRSAIGLGWKAGIAAEVLTVPRLAIGKQIFESKVNLETTDLFAWTLLVILLSLALEALAMLLLKKAKETFDS